MSSFRVVSMATLRRRLGEALGEDPDLVLALDEGDLRLLEAVVQMVVDVPEASRDTVESAIADWILADEPEATSIASTPAATLH